MEPGRAGSILLVDDDEAGRVAHARVLRGRGYEVLEADSGQQALLFLHEKPLDLVISDIALPGCSGREVLRHIKSSPELALVPVMYLSATYPEAGDIAAGLEEGADAYLTKPVPFEVLLAQVAALLRVRRLHLELEAARGEAERRAQALAQAEETSRESEERFRSLVEATSDWIWEVDAQGVYTYASPKVKELLGYEPAEVVGGTPFDLMPPEEAERVAAAVAPHLTQGEPFANLVKRNLHRDGHIVVLETSGVPVFDGAGRLRGFRGVDRDITARLQAEQEQERLVGELERTARELEEQRALLAAVVEHMPSGVVVVEAGTRRVLLRNDAFEQIVRQSVPVGADVARLHWTRRHPDGREYQPAELPPVRALRHGEVIAGEEMLLTYPDGGPVTVLSSAAPVQDAEGRVVSVVSVFYDITARKRAEEALRGSEERLRLALKAAQSGTWEWDLRTSENVWSEELWPLYSLEPHGCEPSYDSWAQTIYPEDRARTEYAVQEAARQGTELNAEWRVREGDHPGRWLMSRAEPVRDAQGQVVRYRGIVVDITARKRAEEALQASELRYRTLFESMQEGFFLAEVVCDTAGRPVDGRFLEVNPAGEALLRRPREEMIGRTYRELFRARDWEYWVTHLGQVGVTGEPVRLEQYGALGERHYEVFAHSPRPGQVACFFSDVTDRVRAEQERARLLAEAEQKQRLLDAVLEYIPEGITIASAPEVTTLVTSRYAVDLLTRGWDTTEGLSKEDWLSRVEHYLADGVTPAKPEDLPLWRAVKYGQTTQEQELTVRTPDGQLLPILCNAGPIRDAAGKITGGIIAWRDISLRKRRQEALAHQARLLQTIQESTPESLAYVDRDLRFLQINSSFARMVCLPAPEILGRAYPEVLPDQAETISCLHEVLVRGTPVARQEFAHVPYRRPDLGTRYLDASYIPVKNAGGGVDGLVISVMDVTDRVEQRERLLAAERARAEIAESLNDEISHRVKNNLAMVSGLLSMQVLSESNPETAAALRDAVTRVRTFASIHEQMYTQPGEELDLLEALRRITNTTRSVFSARHGVEIGVQGERVICPARDVTNLCVVANELITNALKHGAPDEEGKLRVHVRLTTRADHLVLSVWNCGASLSADFDISRERGMGLRLVGDLVTQYEGEFQLCGSADGTMAEVKIPKPLLA